MAQFVETKPTEKNNVEETAHELECLSDRIDLAVNYLSCLSLQLSKGENTTVIWSLTEEKGLSNLMSNLEGVSNDIAKATISLKVPE